MSLKPSSITEAEFKELIASEELQGEWGAENAQEMAEILKGDCIVKFSVEFSTPAYSGDLFVLQSDNLDIPTMRLTRGLGGQMVIVRPE